MAKNAEKKDEIIEVEAEKVEEEAAVETLSKKGKLAIFKEKHPAACKWIKIGSIVAGSVGAIALIGKLKGRGGGSGFMDLGDYSIDEEDDGSNSENSTENTDE